MTTVDLVEHILDQLDEVRDRCPELRFGQLIATIGMLAEDETGHSLWDVEDADFATALERFAVDLARREPGGVDPIAALELRVSYRPHGFPTAPAGELACSAGRSRANMKHHLEYGFPPLRLR